MELDCIKLRKLRDKKKISQLELAEALELSQSSVAKYEKANAQIKFNTLLLLCDFFEVDPKELLVEGDAFYPPQSQKATVWTTNTQRKQITYLMKSRAI